MFRIVLFASLLMTGCSFYENMRLDGPSDTEAHRWAGYKQGSQMAKPMGGTRRFFHNAWHCMYIPLNEKIATQWDKGRQDAGPMALWYMIVMTAGGTIDFGITVVGDFITLPYTIPKTILCSEE